MRLGLEAPQNKGGAAWPLRRSMVAVVLHWNANGAFNNFRIGRPARYNSKREMDKERRREGEKCGLTLVQLKIQSHFILQTVEKRALARYHQTYVIYFSLKGRKIWRWSEGAGRSQPDRSSGLPCILDQGPIKDRRRATLKIKMHLICLHINAQVPRCPGPFNLRRPPNFVSYSDWSSNFSLLWNYAKKSAGRPRRKGK